MSGRLAFVHTSPVHPATFDALLAGRLKAGAATHIVDEALLAEARSQGITLALRQRLLTTLRAAAASADVVICTCSTLGSLAEELDGMIEASVLRVDRPMAQRAVMLGERIVVAASLASTLQPTCELIQDAAVKAGSAIKLIPCLVEKAWPLFEGNDLVGYRGLIAAALESAAASADVVVLAQASMASITLTDKTIPVLSSPELAVEQALALLG